ncbi:MAG: hypothetical protein AB7T06_29565 [Kofleriaceae bacterium]
MGNPVQSIRVAAALLGRFPGLMKQASGTSSEVELAIGEANQLYPEIWRHLDEAQRELVDRDTRAYDVLRASVLAELGITDIHTASTDWYTKYGTYAGTTHQKVVSFNYAGYQRALAACKALQAAMPEVDWNQLAREDVRAIAEAGSLQSAKYKAFGKVAAILAGLALVTYGIYYVVSDRSDGVPDDEAAEMRARAAEREASAKKLADEVAAKRARIDELRVTVKATCSHAAITELATLLREEGQLTDAKKLESTPCVPARPRCKPIPGVLLDRLAQSYESVLSAPAIVSCDGIMSPGSPLVPAYSVWFVDKGTLIRGVVSVDGTKDIVPFAPGPGEIVVNYGDLDDDGTDEAVFATAGEIWVGKIVDGAYVDVRGPRSTKKCREEVNVERDLRPDRSQKDRLIITTLEGTRGCDGERRYFKLVSGALVEE